MPLTWDVTKVIDHESVCFNEDGSVKLATEAIVFYTMPLGLGEISVDNAAEFYGRVKLYEALYGPLMRDGDGEPRPLTLEEVRAHVGLTTNVAKESKAVWLRRMTSMFIDEREAEFAKTLEAAAV